jgi:autoinducer 2 (AI-2) kinase
LNLDKIKEFTSIDIDTIIFASGASKGDLWCQILADVTKCTVKVPKVKEATALGACISAGVGAGIYEDISTMAKKLVLWEKEYKPNTENSKLYEAIKLKWIEAYTTQLKLVDDNITSSMWKAPGL